MQKLIIQSFGKYIDRFAVHLKINETRERTTTKKPENVWGMYACNCSGALLVCIFGINLCR